MVYALIFFALLFVDQISKALAYAFDIENITIIPNILSLEKLRNPARSKKLKSYYSEN